MFQTSTRLPLIPYFEEPELIFRYGPITPSYLLQTLVGGIINKIEIDTDIVNHNIGILHER